MSRFNFFFVGMWLSGLAITAHGNECVYHGELTPPLTDEQLRAVYKDVEQPLLFVLGERSVFLCNACNDPAALRGGGDSAGLAGHGDDARLGRAAGDDARIAGAYDTEAVQGLSDSARVGGSSERGVGVGGRGDEAQIAGGAGGLATVGGRGDEAQIAGASGDSGSLSGLGDQAGLAGASGESRLAGSTGDAAGINGSWQTTTVSGGQDSVDIATGYFALSCHTRRESGRFVLQNSRQLQLDVFDGNVLTQYQTRLELDDEN